MANAVSGQGGQSQMTDYEDDQLKEENARKQRDMAQREIDDTLLWSRAVNRASRCLVGAGERPVVFRYPPMDAMAMAFNEGQRNLALELFQRVMAHCPEQYLKMAKEASEQE